MCKHKLLLSRTVLIFGFLFLYCSGENKEYDEVAGNDYATLVNLFNAFREFQRPKAVEGVPDYTVSTMENQYRELKNFQRRLASIDPGNWTVSEQIDYHLVRARMNGLEFQHRVQRPWARDPNFYSNRMVGLRRTPKLPLEAGAIADCHNKLQLLPKLYAQAKQNLGNITEIPGALATLAIHAMEENSASFRRFVIRLAEHHPDLITDAKNAQTAIDDYLGWLEENKDRMTASAGVGKENYNWLLKNVYLFPYTWEDCRRIVELEDNRVVTFQKLEENRNRKLKPIKPATSQAQYERSVKKALEHIMRFLRDEEIFTVEDYLETETYFGSWHGFENPWPEKHDYFFNFSHREPVMEETHECVGHHFDGLRAERDNRPIRGARHPYKISTGRGEGFAFALEELLMHAGYLDDRPRRGREIAYEQAAFRTVRALSDVYMHSGEWTLEDAMAFCVKNAPHGKLLDNSPHLWFELATTLRGVGHHMIMVVGKVQFMKLFRDRAKQAGDDFVLKEFMDEFLAAGMIPMALIRWEMTGYDDEIKELW